MVYERMAFKSFQQKRNRILQAQVRQGLAPYMLRYGLISAIGYLAGIVLFRLLRHRPLPGADHLHDWMYYAIPALAFSLLMPLVNFYSIRKQLMKAEGS